MAHKVSFIAVFQPHSINHILSFMRYSGHYVRAERAFMGSKVVEVNSKETGYNKELQADTSVGNTKVAISVNNAADGYERTHVSVDQGSKHIGISYTPDGAIGMRMPTGKDGALEYREFNGPKAEEFKGKLDKSVQTALDGGTLTPELAKNLAETAQAASAAMQQQLAMENALKTAKTVSIPDGVSVADTCAALPAPKTIEPRSR